MSYLRAKRAVLESKYAIELVEAVETREITESILLREIAWVVLSAGMRETVVRTKFPRVSECFFQWTSASVIARSQKKCIEAASAVFGHGGKLNAIVEAAVIINKAGFERIRCAFVEDPYATLRQFPYIGSATAYHLAKNLGVKTAKPDRHLSRLSAAAGHASVEEFCELIAAFVGDDVRIVDTVLWRFATLNRNYVALFGEHQAALTAPV